MKYDEARKLSGKLVRLKADSDKVSMPDHWTGEPAQVVGFWEIPHSIDMSPCGCLYCLDDRSCLIVGWKAGLGWPLDDTREGLFAGTQGCVSAWFVQVKDIEVIE